MSASELRAARGDAGDGRRLTPGGLVVVGSHVGVTQRQLAHLVDAVPARVIEIDVAAVVDPGQRPAHLAARIADAVAALESGTVIVQTSRQLVVGADPDASLAISRAVSAAVVAVVAGVIAQVRPAFVLAKGGITSSDVAAKALRMRRAVAVGPMLPGLVSLWLAGDGPGRGTPYVVFPGNVGDDGSLAEVVGKLVAAFDEPA